MEDKKVLLSVKDLEVKFRVRGRILTAIRGISLDIYENESIAIVGESGSGKSVFTKTFAGMLDSNGFISQGELVFNDDELADTVATPTKFDKFLLDIVLKLLNRGSKLELGADIYQKILALKAEKKAKYTLSEQEHEKMQDEIDDLKFKRTEAYNLKLTLNPRKERDRVKETKEIISDCDKKIKALQKQMAQTVRAHKQAAKEDVEFAKYYADNMAKLKEEYKIALQGEITEETVHRNAIIGKEIYLSVGRYGPLERFKLIVKILFALRKAMRLGVDLTNDEQLNQIFDPIAFRVKFLDGTTETQLHGVCVLNLAKIKYTKDWQKIRGTRIATVFQDPMTSLNPIITIGKQISSIIIKHQHCSEVEARRKAIELMKKVGIPNAENRYDDYPFQYSGGMRQRIVIAIALSCQPKILICDEPTTALDVTIQAQILKLIKDLQKEFNYTIVFITHDLGVVANIADRVAVLYAGQIVELGTVDEVFYDPRHPYTWALLSSLPQLAEKNTELYSISGTPPSLYNKIIGDPFAPRNPYCLKVDTLKEAPMFQVSETHFAKTWLLDPRAPKIEKPEIIKDIHGRLLKAFNIEEVK
ncbi:MAG TPA: peptide ABC transporter ATP-binding protein [Clostridiales bacterium]|nr:peptide ABC transporter ATP-binding protein [Clostridiales bacterium]